MKMAKATDEEWEKVMQFVNELDDKVNSNGGYVENDDLGSWVRNNMPPMMRVCYGYRVLVDNCCDPTSDVLEFKPELARLLAGA